jgi:uncharacterized membrane protein
MDIIKFAAFGFVALAFLTAAYIFPHMPEQMASHWNISGEVNGYCGRGFGVFFMPALSLALLGLFTVLPMIDPMGKNYSHFRMEYDTLVALIMAFLYYTYVLMLIYNMGISFEFSRFLSPAFGILFFYMGVVIRKAKQNWFVGIRTPWTLSSEHVWDRTHRFSGDLFKAAGIVAFLGILFQEMLLVSVSILIAAVIFGFVYSYIEFHREKRGLSDRARRRR